MSSNMTPSAQKMTDGQIDKAIDIFRAQLRKHRNDFGSEAVQLVIGQPELGTDLLSVFRKRVEAVSDTIVRHVKADRTRSPQAALDATDRRQYTDKEVVDAMPWYGAEEDDVHFFKLNRWASDEDADNEFAIRGLKPVDPCLLAKVNEDDPSFADEHPNCTHWKDAKGNWCFAAFNRDGGERGVCVYRSDDGWSDSWWFAGVRK